MLRRLIFLIKFGIQMNCEGYVMWDIVRLFEKQFHNEISNRGSER